MVQDVLRGCFGGTPELIHSEGSQCRQLHGRADPRLEEGVGNWFWWELELRGTLSPSFVHPRIQPAQARPLQRLPPLPVPPVPAVSAPDHLPELRGAAIAG